MIVLKVDALPPVTLPARQSMNPGLIPISHVAEGAETGNLPSMNPADIRAFVRRDRAPVEEEKRAYLAEAYREGGPEETLLAAARMYEYARAVRPDFPTEADLAEDLAHQVAFKKRLMAIARALPGLVHVRRGE